MSVSLGSSAVFRWRRQSCPDDDGHMCWLGHGDILVVDGQCQDEFLHRTDPGREQERINLTFRWVKQHASSCPLFKAGVACCLPTCVQGCSFPVMGDFGVWFGIFWGFVDSSWCLVHMGSSPLACLLVARNVSDVVDGAGVFLYRDSSIAPLLDLRRRLKAVMDVLNSMIRFGISFARSVELTTQ